MSFSGKAVGSKGEDLASEYLIAKGYRVLRKNYSTKIGEIDLIAQDGDTTVFIEVKTFADNSWQGVSPVVNVTPAKQRAIIRVARRYLAEINEEPFCRFDVVSVRIATEIQIEHFMGAFTA